MNVHPSGASCGASVTGLQLSDLSDQATIDALREAWLTHKIIAIHDFALTLDELQLVASYFGPFGEDPFFESLPNHP
ncbi:MAG: TauD/TfdA family dioxygenase, partial [Gammaproteobacteria bacterium]|nr:TauD/TfdA family dioxygenase [Gammaproteobacteria bacterium]